MTHIHAQSTHLADESWTWLIGATVVAIEHDEHTWRFLFSNGGQCQADGGTWTLAGPSGLVAASDDHGHKFGLPAPVDCIGEAMAALRGHQVVDAVVSHGRPDLVIRFDSQLRLDVLALSRGYECWCTTDP